MIALDASVLVAHLSPFDAHHDAATGILLAAADEPLLVHAITMAAVLVGGVKIGKGAEMRADLQAAGILIAGRDDDEPLRVAELRATTGLRLPDCCVLDIARTNDARLDLRPGSGDRSPSARRRGVALTVNGQQVQHEQCRPTAPVLIYGPYGPSGGRWTRASQKSSMPLTAARKASNATGLVT